MLHEALFNHHPSSATDIGGGKAVVFIVAVVVAAIADSLSRQPVYAWYWHVGEIAYAAIASLLIARRWRTRN